MVLGQLLTLGVGAVAIVAIGLLVNRDARRLGVRRVRLWIGIATLTPTIALVTLLTVSGVPIPGVLALAIAGPVLYLFERDDTRHGDEPASPHVLPEGQPGEHREPPAGSDSTVSNHEK